MVNESELHELMDRVHVASETWHDFVTQHEGCTGGARRLALKIYRDMCKLYQKIGQKMVTEEETK